MHAIVLYKLFTKIVLTHTSVTLNEAQCRTSWISQGIQLRESHPNGFEEYRGMSKASLPLVLTFVGYEKALDNVETYAILSAH
ncbi:unnamed protein product [Strongylus vulgaris]|uniref:Uncharacterized protein n=1 Tax=Strongylus vulgaris TaxID=40348 RepID=A0A3P7L4L7_STRVU|nr:unnamed protein product [Strongylus vulgaris]